MPTPHPEFQPAHQYVVDALVAEANVTAATRFYDLGSGDGRLLAAFARAGATCVGIEHDPDLVAIAASYVAGENLPKITIIDGDIYAQDYSAATHVWVSINYRKPTDRLANLKAVLSVASGAFVVVNDGTWGWPIAKTITIPDGRHITAMGLQVLGSQDWDILRDLTIRQVMSIYPHQVKPHWAKHGPQSFVVYRVP